MKLRHPNPGDHDQLVALGRALHQESWYRDFDFDPAKMIELVELATASPTMLPLVLETAGGRIAGFFLAAETTHFFGKDRYACDVAIYIAPEHRGGPGFLRMMKAYEAWCRIRGVKEINIGVSSGIAQGPTQKLYEKLGFHQTAVAYRKKCVWPN